MHRYAPLHSVATVAPRYAPLHPAAGLTQIIGTINSFVCTFDSDGRLDSCNHSLAPLLGVSEQVLRARPFDESLQGSGAGLERLRGHLGECARSGTQGGERDEHIELATGGASFVTYYVAPLIQQGGDGGTEEDVQVGGYTAATQQWHACCMVVT